MAEEDKEHYIYKNTDAVSKFNKVANQTEAKESGELGNDGQWIKKFEDFTIRYLQFIFKKSKNSKDQGSSDANDGDGSSIGQQINALLQETQKIASQLDESRAAAALPYMANLTFIKRQDFTCADVSVALQMVDKYKEVVQTVEYRQLDLDSQFKKLIDFVDNIRKLSEFLLKSADTANPVGGYSGNSNATTKATSGLPGGSSQQPGTSRLPFSTDPSKNPNAVSTAEGCGVASTTPEETNKLLVSLIGDMYHCMLAKVGKKTAKKTRRASCDKECDGGGGGRSRRLSKGMNGSPSPYRSQLNEQRGPGRGRERPNQKDNWSPMMVQGQGFGLGQATGGPCNIPSVTNFDSIRPLKIPGNQLFTKPLNCSFGPPQDRRRASAQRNQYSRRNIAPKCCNIPSPTPYREPYQTDQPPMSRHGYRGQGCQPPVSRHGCQEQASRLPTSRAGYPGETCKPPVSRHGHQEQASQVPMGRAGYPGETCKPPVSRHGHQRQDDEETMYTEEPGNQPLSRHGHRRQSDPQPHPAQADKLSMNRQGYQEQADEESMGRPGYPRQAGQEPLIRPGYRHPNQREDYQEANQRQTYNHPGTQKQTYQQPMRGQAYQQVQEYDQESTTTATSTYNRQPDCDMQVRPRQQYRQRSKQRRGSNGQDPCPPNGRNQMEPSQYGSAQPNERCRRNSRSPNPQRMTAPPAYRNENDDMDMDLQTEDGPYKPTRYSLENRPRWAGAGGIGQCGAGRVPMGANGCPMNRPPAGAFAFRGNQQERDEPVGPYSTSPGPFGAQPKRRSGPAPIQRRSGGAQMQRRSGPRGERDSYGHGGRDSNLCQEENLLLKSRLKKLEDEFEKQGAILPKYSEATLALQQSMENIRGLEDENQRLRDQLKKNSEEIRRLRQDLTESELNLSAKVGIESKLEECEEQNKKLMEELARLVKVEEKSNGLQQEVNKLRATGLFMKDREALRNKIRCLEMRFTDVVNFVDRLYDGVEAGDGSTEPQSSSNQQQRKKAEGTRENVTPTGQPLNTVLDRLEYLEETLDNFDRKYETQRGQLLSIMKQQENQYKNIGVFSNEIKTIKTIMKNTPGQTSTYVRGKSNQQADDDCGEDCVVMIDESTNAIAPGADVNVTADFSSRSLFAVN